MKVQNLGNGIHKVVGDKPSGSTASESIDAFTFLDYKIDFLHNNYNYFLYDSLVDLEFIDETNTTSEYLKDKFQFASSSSGQTEIITSNYTIDETSTFSVGIDYTNNSGDSTATDNFVVYISIDNGSSWTEITPNQLVSTNITTQVKFKFVLPAVDGFLLNSFVTYMDKEETTILSGNLAKKVVKDTVNNNYKIDLYNSTYDQMFVDGFVNDGDIDTSNSTTELADDFNVVVPSGISSGILLSTTVSLDNPILEAKPLTDYTANSGVVEIYLSNDGGSSWVVPDTNNVCKFSSENNQLKAKIKITKAMGSDVSPILHSYSVLF